MAKTDGVARIIALAALGKNGGGSTGGTTNYLDLINKPKINNVELTGNKTLEDLGINIPELPVASAATLGGIKVGENLEILDDGTLNAKGADKDNLTITENTDGKLQSVGVLDSNTNTVTKVWTGTLAEYNAITSKDAGTIYYITDEEDTHATQEYVDNAIQTALGTIESELGGI